MEQLCELTRPMSCRITQQFTQCVGYQPTVIEYLKTGWTRPQPLGLFAAAGLTPKTALRETKSPARELGLLEDNVPFDAVLETMIEHPILVNRPIVCTRLGVRLCRPSEAVIPLLEHYPSTPFHKEDGEVVEFPTVPSA